MKHCSYCFYNNQYLCFRLNNNFTVNPFFSFYIINKVGKSFIVRDYYHKYKYSAYSLIKHSTLK